MYGKAKPLIMLSMKNNIIRYASMSLLAIFVLIGVAAYASGAERVTANELKAMLDAGEAVVLIDVRTPYEHSEAHIPGSVLMPLDTLDGAMLVGGRVVVYCRSGKRSLRAMEILKAKGYTGLVDLDGGIMAWIAAGGTVVPGE